MNSSGCDDEFAHRQNADGTFDFICLSCYLTVSSALSESELVPWRQPRPPKSEWSASRRAFLAMRPCYTVYDFAFPEDGTAILKSRLSNAFEHQHEIIAA